MRKNLNGFNREAVAYRSRGREPTVEDEMLPKPRSGDISVTQVSPRRGLACSDIMP